MKKITLICFLFLFIVGCGKNMGDDDLSRYKGIAWAELPNNCIEHNNDVCALFDCMVDRCWCDDSSPELPVLYEGSKSLQTNDEAVTHVQEYIDANNLGQIVKRGVELNSIFFNVFAEDEEGNEITYTIAVDGTIIKTICGV